MMIGLLKKMLFQSRMRMMLVKKLLTVSTQNISLIIQMAYVNPLSAESKVKVAFSLITFQFEAFEGTEVFLCGVLKGTYTLFFFIRMV